MFWVTDTPQGATLEKETPILVLLRLKDDDGLNRESWNQGELVRFGKYFAGIS